ncbi:chemotaxis protein CheB [Dyella sp. ASV21]|uniref:chemotaxis protein CheB n=1 Tax=Dyella sp. ASV21 TaxID=2795114 RepID=UPI0018EB325B|nr:chemotaxis protein CheB [Dyella sp. ASV21]
MAESATAVALLFDDQELGSQLREALKERGARIVHEGALSTLSRDMLAGTGAQVLVVNLDEEVEDDLDRLYDVIDGDHPRVVFNDAQASRELDGWDRARWARHLAVKVLAQGDLDPPRPQHAPGVVDVLPEAPAVATMYVAEATAAPEGFFEGDDSLVAGSFHHAHAVDEPLETAAESESLAAELEALLAADEDAPEHDEFGSGLKFSVDDDLPPLHDGHFGAVAEAEHATAQPFHDEPMAVDLLDTQGPAPFELAPQVDEPLITEAARVMPSFQLDHLSLAPLDDSFMPATAAVGKVEPSLLDQASHWALVDTDDAPASAAVPAPPVHAAEFGIEKLSASDFLAPEGGEEHELQPGMSLELVSIEEAIAPVAYEGGHEMLLENLDTVIGRLLVLGAAAGSADAVCAFLSHLPTDLRMTVLHVQHLRGTSAEALADVLGEHSPLPVRVAEHGGRARHGEVLVVPDGQQARVHRDGRIELQALEGMDVQSSPIDASFTMAANVYGRSAQAIVFAGHANDAVGGCQAIYDRGGQVWVEASSEGHFADMVNGIEAEHLHSYSGTPAELAARLVEEMSMERRR